MKDNRLGSLLKSLLWGIGWFLLAIVIGFLITKITLYKSFESVVFIEGLILIFVGIFTSISGNPMGISMQGLGQNNSQFISNANLEVARIENDKSDRKLDILFAVSTLALVVGGVLSIGVAYII